MSPDEAVSLLEEVLHLRMNGENAPGGSETWADLDPRIEAFLRSVWSDAAEDRMILEGIRARAVGALENWLPGWTDPLGDGWQYHITHLVSDTRGNEMDIAACCRITGIPVSGTAAYRLAHERHYRISVLVREVTS